MPLKSERVELVKVDREQIMRRGWMRQQSHGRWGGRHTSDHVHDSGETGVLLILCHSLLVALVKLDRSGSGSVNVFVITSSIALAGVGLADVWGVGADIEGGAVLVLNGIGRAELAFQEAEEGVSVLVEVRHNDGEKSVGIPAAIDAEPVLDVVLVAGDGLEGLLGAGDGTAQSRDGKRAVGGVALARMLVELEAVVALDSIVGTDTVEVRDRPDQRRLSGSSKRRDAEEASGQNREHHHLGGSRQGF